MTTRELLIACVVAADGLPIYGERLRSLIIGRWRELGDDPDAERLRAELIEDLDAAGMDWSFLKTEEGRR